MKEMICSRAHRVELPTFSELTTQRELCLKLMTNNWGIVSLSPGHQRPAATKYILHRLRPWSVVAA